MQDKYCYCKSDFCKLGFDCRKGELITKWCWFHFFVCNFELPSCMEVLSYPKDCNVQIGFFEDFIINK